MTIVDDFNRFAFERARSKYDRRQYDQMSTDDWCALVETYFQQRNDARDELANARCQCGCENE